MGYIKFQVNTLDELIDVISSEVDKEINYKKKFVQVCEEIGLYDTVALFDYRTLQLFELYTFYKHSPDKINNMVFFDAVNILNQYEPRLI